jgi:hypothetical protein
MEKREKTVHQIARHIHIALSLKYDYQPIFKRIDFRKRLPLGRRHGNYLYLVYLFVKVIYMANAVGQLFLMNSFFGFQYHSYGIDFLRKFLKGDDYSRIDKAFPRVTFCDFKIRNMADNIHQHSVQCALPINLFNEKFFIYLWFWLMFLTLFTFVSFFGWFKLLFRSVRKNTIAKYLRTHNKLGDSEKEREMFNSFIDDFCHLDGAFMFEIIKRNSNYITTSEIICALWGKYCRDFSRLNLERMQRRSKEGANDSVEIGMIDYEDQEKAPFQS